MNKYLEAHVYFVRIAKNKEKYLIIIV